MVGKIWSIVLIILGLNLIIFAKVCANNRFNYDSAVIGLVNKKMGKRLFRTFKKNENINIMFNRILGLVCLIWGIAFLVSD